MIAENTEFSTSFLIKRLFYGIIALNLFGALIFFIFFDLLGVFGIFLGFFSAFLNLWSFKIEEKKISESKKLLNFKSYFIIRYLINGAFLGIAGFVSIYSLFGAFFGIISLRISVYLYPFFLKRGSANDFEQE